MLRGIAFDFGGTLFSTNRMGHFTGAMTDAFTQEAQRQFRIGPSLAIRLFDQYAEEWRVRRDRAGSIPDKEINSLQLLINSARKLKLAVDDKEANLVAGAFHSVEAELFTLFSGVSEGIVKLRGMGFQLGIVCNNPSSMAVERALERSELRHFFKTVVVSGNVGYRKPHPRIFKELVAGLELSPNEILMVGDSFIHDIKTPIQLGMRTCLVDLERNNKNSQNLYIEQVDGYATTFPSLIQMIQRFAGLKNQE